MYRAASVENAGELTTRVHHRELMCRIFDGTEEVISAEYLPMVLQFGLSEEYDRQQISRLIPFLSFWPEESALMYRAASVENAGELTTRRSPVMPDFLQSKKIKTESVG